MIQAVIIDDELSGRKTLSRLLGLHLEQIQILGTAASVRKGKQLIESSRPGLVFLDIDMRDGTGFDLLEDLEYRDFSLVFVTAYSEFALKAFRFYALGYLLKPVGIEELKEVVQEAVRRNNQQKAETQKQLQLLRDLLASDRSGDARLGLPSLNGIQFVSVSSIIWCQANESYTDVHLEGKMKIVVSKKLIDMEELLSSFSFFRIHRTYLINLAHLQSYVRGNGGHVVLSGGVKLDVSRRRKEEFLQRIKALR